MTILEMIESLQKQIAALDEHRKIQDKMIIALKDTVKELCK